MTRPPKRIWLQWHGDSDPEFETGEVSEGDVTWCRDKIFEHDIEYVRIPLATNASKCECGHDAEDHARGQMRRTEPCEAPNCECTNYRIPAAKENKDGRNT